MLWNRGWPSFSLLFFACIYRFGLNSARFFRVSSVGRSSLFAITRYGCTDAGLYTMRLHSLLFPPSRIHIRRTERERPQSIFTFIPVFNVVKSTNERDRRERRPFAYEKTRSFFSTSSGWVRPSVITPKPHVAPNYADKFFLLSLSVIYFWLFFKFSDSFCLSGWRHLAAVLKRTR